MPDISVLLRTYNRREWLEEAVDSILSQEGADFELIITDVGDGLDGTPEYLASIRDPRVVILGKPVPDLGLVTIPDEASGTYLTFFCDDDRMLPDSLRSRVEYLKSHPHKKMVFTSCQNTEGQMLTMGHMSDTNLDIGATFGTQIVTCSMPVGTVMIEATLAREALEEWLSQEERHCSDWMLWLFCLKRIPGAAYLCKPTFQYRIHANTDSQKWGWEQGGFAKTHKAVWDYFIKHGYRTNNPYAINAMKEIAELLKIEVPEEVYA